MKTCRNCGTLKSASAFGRNTAAVDGLQQWCKDCLAANHRTPRAIARTPASQRRRRISPYVRMAVVLDGIERHADDPERVRELVATARETYRLPVGTS